MELGRISSCLAEPYVDGDEDGIRGQMIYIELGARLESTTSARLAWGSWGPRMMVVTLIPMFRTLRLYIQKLEEHVRAINY